MPLCLVFLLYYHITFFRRKKEVKRNKNGSKMYVEKFYKLSIGRGEPFFSSNAISIKLAEYEDQNNKLPVMRSTNKSICPPLNNVPTRSASTPNIAIIAIEIENMNVNPDVIGVIIVVIAWFTLLAIKYVFLNLSVLISLYFLIEHAIKRDN